MGEEDENGNIDYSKLKTEHCLSSDIDEGCDEITPVPENLFTTWKGVKLCG